MIPHTQTIYLNDPRGIPGDCMRTAVASLLDLPTEAVPHFVLFDAPGAWFKAFALWLHGRNLQARPLRQQDVDRPVLAIGTSPRGVEHIVIWGPAGLIHDPHPSHAGIEPRQYWALEPLPAHPTLHTAAAIDRALAESAYWSAKDDNPQWRISEHVAFEAGWTAARAAHKPGAEVLQ